MSKKTYTAFHKFFLYQKNIIETVINQLKSICQIEHTRHRSQINFLVNLISGLAGYCLKTREPSIEKRQIYHNYRNFYPELTLNKKTV